VARDKAPQFERYSTNVWIRFLRFDLFMNKKLDEALQHHALTAPQFYVLATLGYTGGLVFGEIGAKMMVTVSNLTGIVDRLERKGLVVRERDAADRRVVHVRLTGKGGDVFRETVAAFEERVARIFASLTQAEQREMSLLLRKLTRSGG
jgi:DNA-binding MarR family transcriptional regulator